MSIPATVKIIRDYSTIIVDVKGDIALDGADVLGEEIKKITYMENVSDVVFDLTGVEIMTSSGIGKP